MVILIMGLLLELTFTRVRDVRADQARGANDSGRLV